MLNAHASPFFSESLKLISYCPLCESRHVTAEAKIIDENDGAKLIYLRCKKCFTSVVCVIFQNALGVSSVGVITDLVSTDVVKFRSQEDVTIDDVLSIHEFFKKKNSESEIEKQFV